MTLLTLCPSRGRPDAAHALLRTFEETSKAPGSRLLFVVDRDDPTANAYPHGHVLRVRPGGNMGAALKQATVPEVLRDATIVGMIGDDCRFRTAGWDQVFTSILTEAPGVVYGDDGLQHERLPTHWWISRPIVDEFGMTNPRLRHFYMDNYWLELAGSAGVLHYAPTVSIEHLHPLAGKADQDATYSRASKFARQDSLTHKTWVRHGKARDLTRLRRVLGVAPAMTMRVLADWHHPALWESFELLFGRFGWELFSPYGAEWKQHGWSLQNGTPGWSAERYLLPPGAVDRGDHWTVPVDEYPGRERRMVTWAQARDMRWSHVLSSVVAHQRGWGELARTLGAMAVHHVGNARHQLDTTTIRQQVVIASALGVRGAKVTYHQEFDLDMFAPRPPGDRYAVGSFMLRLDSSSCDHTWLSDDPRFHWEAYGAASPDDPAYLSPMSAVAERMGHVGWVWHDKKIGDGYGHVMWNAAAMGRPLIGHASHFKGMIGSALWSDLETAIDLDVHNPSVAAKLIDKVAQDPSWYDELSTNIRERFTSLVDFDVEAQAVKAVLL